MPTSEDKGAPKYTYSIAGILNGSAGPVPLEPIRKESRHKEDVSEAQRAVLIVLRTLGPSRDRRMSSTVSGGDLTCSMCHAFLGLGLLSYRFSSTVSPMSTLSWHQNRVFISWF